MQEDPNKPTDEEIDDCLAEQEGRPTAAMVEEKLARQESNTPSDEEIQAVLDVQEGNDGPDDFPPHDPSELWTLIKEHE